MHGKLAQNPMATVELLPVHGMVRPRRALGDAEFEWLLAASGSRALLYTVAAYTGLRYGEIAALVVGDVKLDQAYIAVRSETTKNGRLACQPLPETLVPALREYIAAQNFQPDNLLFPRMSRKHFPRDAAAAGISRVGTDGRRVGFHSLRHTFCSWLQRAGVSQRVLMELMRHSDRRLSDHLYTDVALLPVREGLRSLPTIPKLSHILTHEIVPASPTESRLVSHAGNSCMREGVVWEQVRPGESSQVPLSPKAVKIGATGFEPATSWSQTTRSTKLSYAP